jgi:hypothetical protein
MSAQDRPFPGNGSPVQRVVVIESSLGIQERTEHRVPAYFCAVNQTGGCERESKSFEFMRLSIPIESGKEYVAK